MNREHLNRSKLAFIFLLVGLLMIPLVHLIMPFFISSEPSFVPAGGGSGSIMAATNVYQQLIPYALAYFFSPILTITGLVLLWKQHNKSNRE